MHHIGKVSDRQGSPPTIAGVGDPDLILEGPGGTANGGGENVEIRGKRHGRRRATGNDASVHGEEALGRGPVARAGTPWLDTIPTTPAEGSGGVQ